MKFREELKKDVNKRNLEPNDQIIQEIIQKTKNRKVVNFPSMFNLRGAACVVIIFAIIFTALFPYYKDLNSSINNSLYSSYKKYNEIYTQITKNKEKINLDYNGNKGWENFTDVIPTAGTPEVDESTSETSINYSDTNLQVVGVSEADIIKTDGSYIYALSYNKDCLYIVKVDGINLELVYTIELEANTTSDNYTEETRYFEFYITENKLILLNKKTQYVRVMENDSEIQKHGSYYIDYYDSYYKDYTGAIIYDITDRTNPVYENDIGTSGYYVSSRMIGDILYLVTNVYMYNDIDSEDPLTYIPAIYNDAETKLVSVDDILICNDPVRQSYCNISSIDTEKAEDISSVKSIFGSGSEIYSSLENMYIVSSRYNSLESFNTYISSNYTDIIKISLNSGNIEVENTGTVKGSVLNQYSMDEYNGYFRIVTSVDEYTSFTNSNGFNDYKPSRTNSLYVLDDQLEIVGSITGLAEDERVYSVRFDGDVGYFVTFRQTDPLFTVDLSNPYEPELLDALKIPGFSTYMHPFGEGLLFGFGMAADETTGRSTSLKLSMFNVSDPLNVTEQNVSNLIDTYSAALDNPKAILISAERNLICIPTERGYKMFQYNTETGFELKGKITLFDINYGDSIRGLYIGDYIYISTYKGIMVYSLDTFELVGQCNY